MNQIHQMDEMVKFMIKWFSFKIKVWDGFKNTKKSYESEITSCHEYFHVICRNFWNSEKSWRKQIFVGNFPQKFFHKKSYGSFHFWPSVTLWFEKKNSYIFLSFSTKKKSKNFFNKNSQKKIWLSLLNEISPIQRQPLQRTQHPTPFWLKMWNKSFMDISSENLKTRKLWKKMGEIKKKVSHFWEIFTIGSGLIRKMVRIFKVPNSEPCLDFARPIWNNVAKN